VSGLGFDLICRYLQRSCWGRCMLYIACWAVRTSDRPPGQGQERNVRGLYFLEKCPTAKFLSDVRTCPWVSVLVEPT
jgi:hypothetical protein